MEPEVFITAITSARYLILALSKSEASWNVS